MSHFMAPAVLLAYARLKDEDRKIALRPSSARPAIGVSVAIVVVLVSGLTLVTIAGDRYLPAIMADRTHSVWAYFLVINVSIIAVAVAALVGLWTRRRTVLDYWLMLICVVLIRNRYLRIEHGSFSLGTRVANVLAHCVNGVLILLLRETTGLYARLARS
jgi:hypothetical protein